MAKRAKETFFVGTPTGKLRFIKDAVVPDEYAKGRDSLVYDDGAKKPGRPRKAAAAAPTVVDAPAGQDV